MVKQTLSGLILVLVGLGVSGLAGAATEATATFDRSSIYQGESVNLIIKVNGASVDSDLDLRPLLTDFEIITTGQSSRMENINGKRFVSTQWNVTLEPLRAGDLQVPALKVGQLTTAPVTLQVLERPEPSDDDLQDMFLEVSVEPRNPYVQSQVLYTLRLHHTLPITEGSLGEPDLPFAVVERIPNDVNYRTERNGRRYTVIERRYAIFPERSGPAQIPSIRFVGRVQDSRAGGNFNRMFDRGRRVSLRSEAIDLEVRPKPATFSGDTWLPARSVTLHDPWKNTLPEFRVGEPVTRTLILQAQGLLETQLPELQIDAIEGFRSYPDQPVSESRKDTPWITAYREEKRAIVPEREGELTLPETALAWWDTTRDQERIALIPAMTVQVLPAADPGAIIEEAVNTLSSGAATTNDGEPADTVAGYWPLLTGAALVMWLLTLLAWWRERRSSPEARPEKTRSAPSTRALQRDFKAAAKSGQAGLAAQKLIDWCDQILPDESVRTLRHVAHSLGDEKASALVMALDRSLYAQSAGGWNGAELLEALRRGLPLKSDAQSTPSAPEALPELYS